MVNGKSAQFLTELEGDTIRILDPAATRLEQDLSPGFERSRLFIETQLRQVTPADEKIHLAHKAAMDTVEYQLDPALQALQQPRQRILIADAVGLGKTLEAGILVTELMRRGRGKRILVLTLKSMMTQFQKEFWNRFTIPLTRLDSAGLQRVRNNIPGNHNPFYYYDKSIISIDTLKQDNEFRRHLEKAYWDIIVIDEAHNVAERSSGSQRAKLAQLLSHRSDTLIMLSATPHDGRARSFASLMNMLDPTAISDPEDYVSEDFRDKGLVIRRFKKDIKDQVKQAFKERVVSDIKLPATIEEEAAYDALLAVPFSHRGEAISDKRGQLLRIGLQKALFSSPAAALVSANLRIRKLTGPDNKPNQLTADEQAEINGLQSLILALQNITTERYGKYQQLISLLQSKEFAWKKTNSEDRLVIFSERIETLKWLQSQLQEDLKLKPEAVELLHGGLSDIDQQRIVEAFGQSETKLRVLLCSDVASEGINLHYLSHRLIHFDLPWSLMVFQQRNGRVDRYGQTDVPQIVYLITESQNATVRGDTRILEVLKEKDQQAYLNIGDPATFMGVHDIGEEEQITEEAMAVGQSAQEFDAELQPDEANEADDLLALFLNPDLASHPANNTEEQPNYRVDPFSLFSSDFDFCHSALKALNRERKRVDFSAAEERHTITLTAPDDLLYRFRYLPNEIRPENGQLVLTQDRERFDTEVKRSREDESAWPKLHYLWPQHPAVEWLQACILAEVARHSAPVLVLGDSLSEVESVFLISGLIPNRKAHPVVWEWLAVHGRTDTGAVTKVEAAIPWLQQLDLQKQRPNRAAPVSMAPLEILRKPAIDAAKAEMLQKQQAFNHTMQPKLVAQMQALDELRGKQVQQLEIQLGRSQQDAVFKNARREQRTRQINQAFTNYRQWVQDTMTIEPVPFLQIIAVLTGDSVERS